MPVAQKAGRSWQRIPVTDSRDRTRFLEADEIYYLEADGHDTLVRTRRRTLYRSVKRLSELEALLPKPPFFRCHNSYLVNLGRVRYLEHTTRKDYSLRLDPPVNTVLPLSRRRLTAFRKIMGAP